MTQGALLKQAKPWSKYKRSHGRLKDKLYQPGYAGALDPQELATLKAALLKDPALALWWGFRPKMAYRSDAAIQAVALHGSTEDLALNVRLVRKRGTA